VLLDLQADEDGQAQPARARLTSARYPAMIPLASSAFTRRACC